MTYLAHLPARGVVAIDGPDRVAFLQGLVSNDVALAAPGRAVWTALLTPQGKWLADFFVFSDGARLLLDCERTQAAFVMQRLGKYRLRSQVVLSDLSETLRVFAAWAGTPELRADEIAAPDPRLPDAGWRILTELALPETATAQSWDAHRLALGLPDGSRDLETEKSVLLEAGFDELGGVSWTKGCYMGQELTARTKYRGLVKRRLVPVVISGEAPAPGTSVTRNGTEVGTLRSVIGDRGLAVVRIDALAGPLASGEATLTPRVPDWMTLPAGVE